MSSGLPQQSVPIIIKGGNKKSSIPIRINANSTFQITEEFQSQSSDWIESASDFSVSYIESLNIGSLSGNPQFCQTSSMAHPLKYAFKDDVDKDIFTIVEVADGNNYKLQISVGYSGSYFQVEQTSEATINGEWTDSVFNSATETEVVAVEVTDSNDVPVCRISRADDSDIFLNLEPPV